MARFVIGKDVRPADEGAPERTSSRGSWNTIQKAPKGGRPFSTSLTLAFAFTALMTTLVLVVVLAVVWEGQFMAYTRQNMQSIADSTAAQLSEAYDTEGELNEKVASEAASASSISPDIVVQVVDADGNVLYDDTWAHGGTVSTSTEGLTTEKGEESERSEQTSRTSAKAPTANEALVVSSIVSKNGKVVGMLRLWALGSDALLTKSDASFRSNSYGAIATAAAIATVLACGVGYFFSRNMSKPIQRITYTAKQLRDRKSVV